MSAKDDLFLRLKYLDAAINLPELVDQGIVVSQHNGVANILRKGLGIVAFNVMEDFIKNKTAECLHAVSQSNLPFANLTDELIESSISGALSSLSFVAGLVKKEGGDWKTLIQDETFKIHSTRNNPFELSKYSLVYGGSNVLPNEIPEVLRAFGIREGWQKLKAVSDAVGGGITDLASSYKNASTRRHSAAHSAAFRYEHVWLSNLKREIIAIAAAFDILLTARCRQLSSNLTQRMDTHNIDAALNYRFLLPHNTVFREVTTMTGRSKRNWQNKNDAILGIKPLLANRNEFLIILDSSRRIEDWFA